MPQTSFVCLLLAAAPPGADIDPEVITAFINDAANALKACPPGAAAIYIGGEGLLAAGMQ